MKILVCGGRDYQDWDTVNYWLTLLNPTKIVQGGAKGADSLAEEWARRPGVTCYRHEANWEEHGKAAGPIRNQAMLTLHPDIDLVIGFAGGSGTQDMLSRAQKAGIPTAWVR